MKSIRLVLTVLFLGFLAVSLTTCGGGGDDSSSSPLASITLSPVTPVGTTQQFGVLGAFSDGTGHDISPQFGWTSSNTSVATINSSGRATSVSGGTAIITATSGSISGITILTVTSATLTSITVTPATPSLPAGTTQQFIATGRYSDGTSHYVSLQVTWASSNPSVATVGSSGMATAPPGSSGAATITATSGSISGSTTLTVTSATLSSITLNPANPSTPVGASQQFITAGAYSDGTSHDTTTQVTWASANPAVATVNASGLATAISAGTTTITATSGSISASTTLTVTSATLSSATVMAAIPVGSIQQFIAIGINNDGSTQNITGQVTWASSNPAVATVTNDGQATSVAAGTASIVATTQANYFPYLLGRSISGATTLLALP